VQLQKKWKNNFLFQAAQVSSAAKGKLKR